MAASPQAAPTARPGAANANTLVGTTCMELALEGERLCKSGDFMNGIGFFEEAIKVGTSDDRTLSAIYSQLGNAYFYMEDYAKALHYHEKDVALVHHIGDQIAEAKACGNLGNTFKMLDKFDEAIAYCRRYLEISRKLGDQVGEGRALYNLGNVYHTRGKRMIGASEQEPGQLSIDIKSSLQKAIEYYEENLSVVSELKDFTSMGRAYGNLGNTHYLLGNFKEAVESHQERLRLAKETHDKLAERRAYLNLGNANVFLGNFSQAIENHTAALKLAEELKDRNTEAHSCYSLANTYTFLKDYQSAIKYHLKYLEMIKQLQDKLGEGRACWSLVNVYQMVNDPESALKYARLHKEIAEQLGDKDGLSSAKLNIQELEEIISQRQAVQWAPDEPIEGCSSAGSGHHQQGGKKFAPEGLHYKPRLTPDKRQEQEQRRFKKQLNSNLTVDGDALLAAKKRPGGVVKSSSSEQLLDMIAHFQSGRIDDQRCEILKKPPVEDVKAGLSRPLDDKENHRDAARLSDTPNHSQPSTGHPASRDHGTRVSQPIIGNPLNAVSAAASAIKATYRKASLANYPVSGIIPQPHRRPTVSAEHRDQLFDLIAGAQRQRMEEQRATLPTFPMPQSSLLGSSLGSRPATGHSSATSSLMRGHTVDQADHIAAPYARPSSARPSLPHDVIAESVFNKPASSESGYLTRNASTNSSNRPKLNRQFQTMDMDHHHHHPDHQVHDEKFLDNLMKYQSTRFDDQRSEIPLRPPTSGDKGNPNDFFNLIVRFQSDRLDDQRSTPVSSARK